MFHLLPKDTVFFDLFEGIAGHAVSAAGHLYRLGKEFPSIDGPLQLIRKEEHDADELSHQALDRLDRTFITPFDREDIHELVGGLDDIIDEIDALAKRFKLYHVAGVEEAFIKQAEILVQSTVTLRDAVLLLRKSRKLSDLSAKLIEIHRLESIGDDNNHAAVSRLYEGKTAPLEVMKWKEFYDRIEKAIDNCEDVGNTLERIVLKNG
jgi:predicted phosphate transport protein (TIGR00153 family)